MLFNIVDFDTRLVHHHVDGHLPAIRLLAAVNRLIVDTGDCCLSNPDLEELAGISRWERRKAMKKLKNKSIIRIEQREDQSGAKVPSRIIRTSLRRKHVEAYADCIAIEGYDNAVKIRFAHGGLVPGLHPSMVAPDVPDVVHGTPRIDLSDQPKLSIPAFSTPDGDDEDTEDDEDDVEEGGVSETTVDQLRFIQDGGDDGSAAAE